MKTSHLDEAIAGMVGRYIGAQFITNRVIFSKRYSLISSLKHGGKFKLLSGFVHSSYGIGMLAIAQGVRSLENLLFDMLTGSQAVLNGDFYKILDKLPITDYEAYQQYDEVKQVLQQLLFLNTESGYKQYVQWNL